MTLAFATNPQYEFELLRVMGQTPFGGRIAPVLAGAALLACGALVVGNYADVTGSSSWWINTLPLVLVGGAAHGAWAQRRATRYLRVDG